MTAQHGLEGGIIRENFVMGLVIGGPFGVSGGSGCRRGVVAGRVCERCIRVTIFCDRIFCLRDFP